MARVLILDWDYDQLHLLAANVSSGQVKIEHALSLNESHTLDSANIERAGERLQKRLKENKIVPAPVVVGLGRERVIFKEISYPPISEQEEPALVRFQASKELMEPADRVLLDYAPISNGGANGKKRALVVIARKDLVVSFQKLCQAAGLKLQKVTARPFGFAAALGLAKESPPSKNTVAVFGKTKSWAEFCVIRNGALQAARSVPQDEDSLKEVRRNLTLFSGQSQGFGGEEIQSLYVAYNPSDENVFDQLQVNLPVSVHSLNPFGGQANLEEREERGAFVSLVGLAGEWAKDQSAGINLVSPRQPKVETGTRREKIVVYGGLAVLAVIGLVILNMLFLNSKLAEVESLQAQITQAEADIKKLAPERKKIAELRNWEQGVFPWADEFYDLAARTPDEVGFRIKEIQVSPLIATGKSKNKNPFTMRMSIRGVVPAKETQLVHDLRDAINKDEHCRATMESMRSVVKGSKDRKELLKEFELKVDLARQPAANYTRKIVIYDPRPQLWEGD